MNSSMMDRYHFLQGNLGISNIYASFKLSVSVNFTVLINKLWSLQLAIGIEGGFSSGPKYEIASEYAVVLFPDCDAKVPLSRSVLHMFPCISWIWNSEMFKGRTRYISRLTPKLIEVCHKIIENEGVQRQEILEEGINVWEGEARTNTRHLNLEQVCRFL